MATPSLPLWEAALLETAIQACRYALEETGSLPPLVVAAGDREARLFQLRGWTPRSKLTLMREVGRQAAALRPRWVALIADAYFKEGNMAQLPPWPLAEDPEARDALTVIIMDRQGRTAIHVCPYRRLPSPEGARLLWEDPVAMPPGGRAEATILQTFWEAVEEASR